MTTAAKQLLNEADAIERHAKGQLTAWTILGQTCKYEIAMNEAAKLRRAAEMTAVERREFLKGAGA